MQTDEQVGLIILAAGASTRMGAPKQLLRINGRSLLRRAAEFALTSTCRPIFVVLGSRHQEMIEELVGLDVRIVLNERWAEGMSSSIRAGITALENDELEKDLRAVVITLCDQPFVTTTVIDRLVTTYFEKPCSIVASEYGGECGVPALFDATLFADLKSLGGAGGAKHLFAARQGEVRRVPFANGLVDVDTPEDYMRLNHKADF